MYIDRAKECGMTALAFSEHGNILNWATKKSLIEAAGMKYVHAIETLCNRNSKRKNKRQLSYDCYCQELGWCKRDK